MSDRIAKPAARFMGAFLLVLAILGWFNTPIIGEQGFIVADTPVIIGYALLGALLAIASLSGESTCAFALYVVALVCILFASYSLYIMGSYNNVKLLDMVVASRTGAYFQIVLALAAATFGKMNTARQQLFHE